MKKDRTTIFVIIIIEITLLAASLLGCKNKISVFEGGHIALQYDKARWKLAYQKEEPYSIFCMEENENYILILPMESDDSILEEVHEELIVDIYGHFGFSQLINVSSGEKIDQSEEQNYAYYNYDFDFTYGKERWIIFEKRLETISVMGIAVIDREEENQEEEELQEKTDEVLAMLSSLSYSDNGAVKWIPERNDLDYFYDMVMWINKNEQIKEETDRESDCVADEETAKKIAEAALDDAFPGWKDRWEYDVNIVYIDQIYKWIVYYSPDIKEGKMLLDCGAEIRIRRDNGEITYFYTSLL